MSANTHKSLNWTRLKAFKAAVLAGWSYEEVVEDLYFGFDLKYSPDHISKVLNGHRRPSYELAVALTKIANNNIRKYRTKSGREDIQGRGARITARVLFDLRSLPVVQTRHNTCEYFETTPSTQRV